MNAPPLDAASHVSARAIHSEHTSPLAGYPSRLFRIHKEFAFSASHRLTGLPPEHQCSRLHGHNYVVRLALAGPLVEPGFVVDYGDLQWFGAFVDERLDHRDLNEQMPGINPTAENLCEWLLAFTVERMWRDHSHIRWVEISVSETPKTFAACSWMAGEQ